MALCESWTWRAVFVFYLLAIPCFCSPSVPFSNFSTSFSRFHPYYLDNKEDLPFVYSQAWGQTDVDNDIVFSLLDYSSRPEISVDKHSTGNSGNAIVDSHTPKEKMPFSRKLGQIMTYKTKAKHLVGTLSNIVLDLEGAYRVASKLRSCGSSLKSSQLQLKSAQRALGQTTPNFPTASAKLLSAKAHIASCLSSIQKSGKTGSYYGQAELENSNSKLKSVISTVSRLASSQLNSMFQNGSPLTPENVNTYGATVQADQNNYEVPYNGTKYIGSRVKSINTYTSGIFSADILCPSGLDTHGLDTAFFLATDAKDPQRSSIIMEFNGRNRSTVSLSTVVNGVMGPLFIVVLDYDCSQERHTYTIEWASKLIIWRNEQSILGLINVEWWQQDFPQGSMHLYLNLNTVNTVGTFQWPTKVATKGVDYIASFHKVIVSTPTDNSNLPGLPVVPANSPMYPISVDYCFDHMKFATNAVRIKFDSKKCGGRIRTTANYLYGEFSAGIRCPTGDTSGLVSSFYLSTLEGSPTRDEIDFELLGGHKNKVLTNIFVDGVGHREQVIDLGFDCSLGFHTYTIRYLADSISWFVDGQVVRKYLASDGNGFPTTPMFLYGSVWNGSDVLNGGFAGNWSGVGMPYYTHYRQMQITSPWVGK